jgi:hypothetical protein
MTRDDLNQNQREARRERVRRARAERHGGGSEHRTRVCPSCRRAIAYVKPLQDPPAECGECGYLWDCPECGQTIQDGERDEEGRPPAVCPSCDSPIEGGYEPDDADGEFLWS